MNTRKRARFLRLGAMLILFGALAPNILYLGHWPLGSIDAHAMASQAGRQDEVQDDHTSHCHTGPAKCGGGESMVGSYFAGEDAQLLSLDAPRLEFDTTPGVPKADGPAARILQPPRSFA